MFGHSHCARAAALPLLVPALDLLEQPQHLLLGLASFGERPDPVDAGVLEALRDLAHHLETESG